jgi:heme-degrading monooxygenase HmoA
MHAVVTRVTVQDGGPATEYLRENIVPGIKQSPGFVAGYWVRLEDGDEGNSVVVFDSEENARQAAERGREMVSENPGVTLESMTVGEVVANA